MSLHLRKKADRNADPNPDGSYPFAGLVIEGDPPATHQFAPEMVTRGAAEGWLSFTAGRIILHTLDGDVVYTVVETPGAFCDLCDTRLGDGPAGTAAQAAPRLAHVAECDGSNDPNPENPAGYRVDNFFLAKKEG